MGKDDENLNRIKKPDEPTIYRDVNQPYQQGLEQPQQIGGADFDYYQALKNENYKSLQNNQVQLANARQQALRNTNNSLNAMGFGSAGYGALQRNGIESAYMQGLTQNQNDFATRNLDINKQQYEAEQKALDTDYEEFITLLEQGDINDTETLNYGFKDFLDKDGNLDMQSLAAKYGETRARNIAWLYEMKKNGLDAELNGEDTDLGSNYTYQEAKKNITDQNGKTGKLNDELGFLYGNGARYIPATEGTVLMVKDNKNGASYSYLVYKNGTWVQTDSKTYHTASKENQYELFSDSNSNLFYNVSHNGQTTRYGKGGKQQQGVARENVSGLQPQDYVKLETAKAAAPFAGTLDFTIGGQKWRVIWQGGFEQWYKI